MSAPHAVRGSSGLTEAQVTAALPELEKYIQEQMKRTGVPGLSIAIVLQDKVVYLKGFGVREAGKNDPVSEDTAFQLASVSKPLGATVIASLVSDGLISWDSKISDLDPSFQLPEPYPTSQLTIRDLYSHRSGLPGEAGTELETFGYSQTEILHRLRYVTPASSFRSAYSYSDFGMTEGGVAAVKPTGKTWEQVSKEKLYTPLGMTHTTSVNSEFLQETTRAALHVMVDGKWTPKLTRQPDAQAPAGGASSTARDMAQWLRLEWGSGTYDDKQLINADALAQTHLPVIVRGKNPITGAPGFYGLGWNIDYDEQGRTIWDHAGAFSVGARTQVTISPSENLGVVVLSNAFPTGLPEAVTATFFDLARYGKSSRDWGETWDKIYDSIFGPSAYGPVVAQFAHPPANASPALPNSAYVGSYGNDYISDVQIIEQDGKLALQLGPKKMTYALKHWGRDVFLFYPELEVPELPSKLDVSIGVDGKATQLTIQDIVESGGDGVVQRVAPTP
jgi:CubicO group peptidase (beta-lactamase class C family)